MDAEDGQRPTISYADAANEMIDPGHKSIQQVRKIRGYLRVKDGVSRTDTLKIVKRKGFLGSCGLKEDTEINAQLVCEGQGPCITRFVVIPKESATFI